MEKYTHAHEYICVHIGRPKNEYEMVSLCEQKTNNNNKSAETVHKTTKNNI